MWKILVGRFEGGNRIAPAGHHKGDAIGRTDAVAQQPLPKQRDLGGERPIVKDLTAGKNQRGRVRPRDGEPRQDIVDCFRLAEIR